MIKVNENGTELVGSDMDLLAELSLAIHVLYEQLKKHYGEAEAEERINFAVEMAKAGEDKINKKADELKEEIKSIIKEIMKEMSVGG